MSSQPPGVGYEVDIDAIAGYSREIAQFTGIVEELRKAVADADVSDASWGIVGVFTKSRYTCSLGALEGLLAQLDSGLRTASDAFASVAGSYRSLELTFTDCINAIHSELDVSAEKRILA